MASASARSAAAWATPGSASETAVTSNLPPSRSPPASAGIILGSARISRRGAATVLLSSEKPYSRDPWLRSLQTVRQTRLKGPTTHPMPVRMRRWNDRRLPGDGLRLLVCRYRPRGVRKSEETWDEWDPDLGPSRALHADVYGKSGPPIPWEEYRERFLAEIAGRRARIDELAARVRAGDTITLLCSSACADDAHCNPCSASARVFDPLAHQRAVALCGRCAGAP